MISLKPKLKALVLTLILSAGVSAVNTMAQEQPKTMLSGFTAMTAYTTYSWNGYSFELPEKSSVSTDTPENFGAMLAGKDFGVQLRKENTGNKKLTSADIKAFALQHIDEFSCEDSKAEFIEFAGVRAAEATGTVGNTGIRVIKFRKGKELFSIVTFYKLSDDGDEQHFIQSFRPE